MGTATAPEHLKLRSLSQLPEEIEVVENTWITMSDGTRLSAKLWLPKTAHAQPVPAIFEYIPYRKRDSTSIRDSMNHRYFAGHGYGCVRVDLRGSGDSEGVLYDEYLQQELDDGFEIIEWIAKQTWCSGQVGMIGISWGGFNGLQIAHMQPEALKAIVTVCSTDDRYADDVHYMGGCLLGDNLSWASVMQAFNACPPDPRIVGEDKWRPMWMERLENGPLWLKNWLEHQHRDDYWRHGSICEDWSRVQIPVLAASGWADGYSNAVFRMLRCLEGPKLGLVGPWSHKYPHIGSPGPAIGFLQECLRWWDHWLKGEETGIMHEPLLRAWMQDAAPPFTSYQERPGRWVAENSWPSPNVERQSFALSPNYALVPLGGTFAGPHVEEIEMPDQSPLSVGLFAGKWCSYASAPDLPGDQREEDGGSLVFETNELEEDLEILGAPELELEVSSSEPVAMVAARLSDLAPDRKATRITYGVLNLCHRNGHANPEELIPGEVYRVNLLLNHVAQTFRKGHRIRIAISTSYWPLTWAPPRAVRLTIHTGESLLHLPVRKPSEMDQNVKFRPAEAAKPVPLQQIDPQDHTWRVIRNLETDESTLEVINDEGKLRFPHADMTILRWAREYYTYRADDFSSLRGEVKTRRDFQRENWHVSTYTKTLLRCDPDNFYVTADLDAFEGEKRVFCRSWNETIPRRCL